jgi:hypothetical protein
MNIEGKVTSEEIINKWLSFIYTNMSNNSISVLFKRIGDNDILAKSKVYQLGLPYNELTYLLVGYIGFNQRSNGTLSFGEACGVLALKMGKGSISKSVEKKLISILKEDDINECERDLYELLKLLNRNNISIDLNQFMKDIMYIGNGKKYTQKRWAKEFWTPKYNKETTNKD